MAKRLVTEGIQLDVTQNYIDQCIELHKGCLVRLIKEKEAPPADGAIICILDAIDALQNRVIASDDKAGRGLGSKDELE